jgi:hypothetical protein
VGRPALLPAGADHVPRPRRLVRFDGDRAAARDRWHVAGCPGCGWSGAPTIVAGERSTFCPSCESEGTEPGEAPLLVAGPEDVYARGPWARLTRRGERGELYRPRPARPAYQRAPLGTVERAGAKVGRNDPCPCGSGKKHKRCCG